MTLYQKRAFDILILKKTNLKYILKAKYQTYQVGLYLSK